MRKKKYYYCDMDGVLADFNNEPQALERFEKEKGFFYNLKPIEENIEFIKALVDSGESVRILSASPNKIADDDKIKWLRKYMPYINKNRIIIIRNGQNKADFVETKGKNILFDDYGKNCNQWEEKPKHKAYKVKTLIRQSLREDITI